MESSELKNKAIEYIKKIQNGFFNRYKILNEIPREEAAEKYWNDSMFSYGMEYGAIYGLMEVLDIKREELQ